LLCINDPAFNEASTNEINPYKNNIPGIGQSNNHPDSDMKNKFAIHIRDRFLRRSQNNSANHKTDQHP
jgi:hypothetical protein